MTLPWKQHFSNVDINCPLEKSLSFGVDFLEEKTLLQMGSLKIKNRFPQATAMFYWGKGLYAKGNGLKCMKTHGNHISVRIYCYILYVNLHLLL